MKIVSIIGARPQFIKEAPLLNELKKKHKVLIIHTGQHYDNEMSNVFFKELNIPKPHYNLGIGSGLHGKQTGEMLASIEKVLIKEKPELVIVFGDTNTTLAGAIAASKLNIKIAHIESGMRSFDRTMPEETNRVLTDHISNILLCSTKESIANLKIEGVKNLHLVGDVMIDSIKSNIKSIEDKSNIMKRLGLKRKDYILATVHRASNTDNKNNLQNIVDAFIESKEKIIFPVHPRTYKYLKLYGLDKKLKKSNIVLIKPIGYFDMLVLEKNAKKITTDSGGVQKEAYFFKVPCITLRNSTEWVETVKDKWNILTGANKSKIIKAIINFSPKGKQHEDYGKGNASKNIVNVINKINS